MYALVSVLAFIVLLGVLIGVHELGHFAAARYFGIQVEEFGFGFPPRLRGWRRNGTLYSINAIPLGGFVRMKGENGDWEDPRSFGAKPAWQRAIVLCAGALMNLVLALLLFFLIYTIAPIPRDTPRVGAILPHSPAATVLRIGDTITAVNGRSVASQSQVHDFIECSAGTPTVLTIDRRGRTIRRTVVPRLDPPAGQGRVGFAGTITFTGTDGWSALGESFQEPGRFLGSIGDLFGKPSCTPQAGLSGPVGIARATGEAANRVRDLGMGPVLYLAAVLSMNLAFVNLLPLPALDGGRLLFVAIGAARRRRIDPRREGVVHLVGFALLMLATLAITWHDISQWIAGR